VSQYIVLHVQSELCLVLLGTGPFVPLVDIYDYVAVLRLGMIGNKLHILGDLLDIHWMWGAYQWYLANGRVFIFEHLLQYLKTVVVINIFVDYMTIALVTGWYDLSMT
jgi:hypothetical protein